MYFGTATGMLWLRRRRLLYFAIEAFQHCDTFRGRQDAVMYDGERRITATIPIEELCARHVFREFLRAAKVLGEPLDRDVS